MNVNVNATHCVFRRGWIGVACACLFATSSQAAQTNVSVINFAFSPATVSIKVNDSVKWTWSGNFHSTTSTTGLWDSGVHNAGFTFTNVFSGAGSFPYFCSVHLSMTGSVNVQAVNSPPSVTITNPPGGTVFSAPASFTLAATASDNDGSVTNVQFFQGAASLGNTAASPYSVSVNGLGAGNYTFSAVASDNGGLKATNTISVSVVTPAAIVISNPERLSATEFRFSHTANAGLRYVVERSTRSTNLPNFVGIKTNAAAGSSVTFTDNTATATQNFYRVSRLPNP